MTEPYYCPRSRIHALVPADGHHQQQQQQRVKSSSSAAAAAPTAARRPPPPRRAPPVTTHNKKPPGVVLHIVTYPGLCAEVGVPPSTPVPETLNALARASTMIARAAAGAAAHPAATKQSKHFNPGNMLVYALIGAPTVTPQYLAVGLTTGWTATAVPAAVPATAPATAAVQGTWSVLSAFGGSANPFTHAAIEFSYMGLPHVNRYAGVFGWSAAAPPPRTLAAGLLGTRPVFAKLLRGVWAAYRDVAARRACGEPLPPAALPACRPALLLELLFSASPASAPVFAQAALDAGAVAVAASGGGAAPPAPLRG